MHNTLNRRNIFILFAFILAISALTSCESIPPKPTEQMEQNKILLDDLMNDGSYAYQDYPWLISKEEFYTKNGMDEKTVIKENDGDIEIVYDKKTIAYSDPKVDPWPVFYFFDDKLIKVRLIAEFTTESDFLTCAANLKAALDKKLIPRYGTTDFLTQSPPVTGSGLGDARWLGNDQSGMEINTFYHAKTEGAVEKYSISITIGPAKER